MIAVVGTGYVGSALVEKLRSFGHRVAAVNRTPEHSGPLDRTCDITDPQAVAALRASLPSPPEIIVNCASSGRGGADAYRRVYLQGTAHLIEVFPGARLLFTSSTSVYAQTDGSWVDEVSPTTPDRKTGQILLETENLVLANGGTVTRLGGIYGPSRSVILQRFLKGLSTIDQTPGTPNGRYLNQVHRADIISALVTLIDNPATAAEVFNIADDLPLTQREIYSDLAARFTLPMPPGAPPDTGRKRGWTHKRISNAKLKSLGWFPAFPSYLDALDGDADLVPSIRSLLSTQ